MQHLGKRGEFLTSQSQPRCTSSHSSWGQKLYVSVHKDTFIPLVCQKCSQNETKYLAESHFKKGYSLIISGMFSEFNTPHSYVFFVHSISKQRAKKTKQAICVKMLAILFKTSVDITLFVSHISIHFQFSVVSQCC